MTGGPRRTCVGCRAVRMKHELVRLVRSPDGVVMVDERGHAAGRGAYVCRSGGCAARLSKAGRLSQAFRRPSRLDAGVLTAVQGLERDRGLDMGDRVTLSRR